MLAPCGDERAPERRAPHADLSDGSTVEDHRGALLSATGVALQEGLAKRVPAASTDDGRQRSATHEPAAVRHRVHVKRKRVCLAVCPPRLARWGRHRLSVDLRAHDGLVGGSSCGSLLSGRPGTSGRWFTRSVQARSTQFSQMLQQIQAQLSAGAAGKTVGRKTVGLIGVGAAVGLSGPGPRVLGLDGSGGRLRADRSTDSPVVSEVT